MAPAIIAAIISALGSMGASYLSSRNRQPGPLGGPGGAQSGFQPVSSSIAADAVKAGTDAASALLQQKVEEERRRREEERRRQQEAMAQQQSTGATAASSNSAGGLRGAIQTALSRALGF